MKVAATLLLLPAALITLLAALLHSPDVDMSASQPATTAAATLSQYVRVAELPGKGRGMLATRDIPQGALLWSEPPLTSSPFPAQSASQLTPQSAIDELALALLADPAGSYRLLCHHVELQHEANAAAVPSQSSSSESASVSLGVPPVSGLIMRRSPVAEWSDLQFSIAASQVQSNAFATFVTAAEVDAIRRAKQQPSQPAAVAADGEEPREETALSEGEDGAEAPNHNSGLSSNNSSKSRKNATKREKRRSKRTAQTASSSASGRADSSSSNLRVLTLYVHISMLNHCCYPNAQVYWPAGDATEGGLQSPRVYAISDVKDGDELCISYRADLLHYPTALRQSVINSSWHFHCACSRCTQPELFPQDAELLGLTQPLSDEQQARMLHSFTALIQYAEQLSVSGDEAELHPRMLRQLFELLALPLSKAHWRRHRLRSLYLPLLLPQSTVSYEDKRRVLDEHIASNARVLPPLHASKLQYLLTFVHLVELEESGRSTADVMKDLTALEPHADDVLRMYE